MAKFLDEAGLAELWSLIRAEDERLAAADVKCAVVSYVGTGAAGKANATSVTFDFVPKILMAFSADGKIYARSAGAYSEQVANIGFFGALTTQYVYDVLWHSSVPNYNDLRNWVKKSEGGNTISWYAANEDGTVESGEASFAADVQMNSAGNTYHIVAIG